MTEAPLLLIDEAKFVLPMKGNTLTIPKLQLNAGETLVMFGPVGCGKTTFLRTLCGFWDEWGGKVMIDGRDLRSIKPHCSRVIMVWQDHRLFDHLTVKENVLFSLSIERGVSQCEYREANNLLELVGLGNKGDATPTELSGGERQLTAILRGVLACKSKNKKLLALDEPYRSLDSFAEQAARDLLRKLQKDSGVAIIEITHAISSATSIGRQIGMIDRGVCKIYESIDELLALVGEDGSFLVRLELANKVGSNWRLAEPFQGIAKLSGTSDGTKTVEAVVVNVERTMLGDKILLETPTNGFIHTFSTERLDLAIGDPVHLSLHRARE